MEIYTVDKVAKRLGISRQTLVRYEKKGIFPKARRNRINNWREYTDKDIQKMTKLLGKGYTIIEVIMAIVIVGVLATLAIPRFQSFYAVKLSGAVKKVVLDIRYTQQLAISRHEDYRIIFNAAGNSYEVRRVSDNAFATDPFTRSNMATNFNTDPQYKNIDITTVNFGGASGLRFDWEGVPRDTNGVGLANEGSVGLSYQGNSSTIYVTPNTGRVRVQ